MPIRSSAGKENNGSTPYGPLKMVIKYLGYYFSASNGKGHGIHSPFVYDFIQSVLLNRERHSAFERIEQLRDALLKDETLVTVEDFGAGSFALKNHQRTVSSIAATSLKSARLGRLMHRMVNHYRPVHIIELGTSLGLTTCYMSSAIPSSKVITLEGSSAIAGLASTHFSELKMENIELMEGRFSETLPSALKKTGVADFIFIDGDHRFQPTVDYFEMILPYAHDGTMLVFDDIHWSPDMEKAWERVKAHPRITLSIDLFFLGIAIFSRDVKEKQHFVIRY